MGSGASILDHGEVKASTSNKLEKEVSKRRNSKTSPNTSKSNLNTSKSDIEPPLNASASSEVGELVNATSEKFSIFEEPVEEIDLAVAEMEKKIDERAARRLSRNILSGEIQGNVLRAQFSMKSVAPVSQHHEYLLKVGAHETEGEKPHATSLADVRKNMREKLSHELSPPMRSVSCVEGLPSLQDLKHKKTTLEAFTSMPNLSPLPPSSSHHSTPITPIPPIGRPFVHT